MKVILRVCDLCNQTTSKAPAIVRMATGSFISADGSVYDICKKHIDFVNKNKHPGRRLIKRDFGYFNVKKIDE